MFIYSGYSGTPVLVVNRINLMYTFYRTCASDYGL